MSVIGIDLGGTKVAIAMFSESGDLLKRETSALNHRTGSAVSDLICDLLKNFLKTECGDPVRAVGVSVPGISRSKSGTVWAPNIQGWEDYPLLKELQALCGAIPVSIDSDRACYILGELWQGNARGCKDVIYLSVGTGIGAGILINGSILRGAQDIAGCIGWMALDRPFKEKYTACGCFESYASGEGIAKVARELLVSMPAYSGELRNVKPEDITAADVFNAFDNGDKLAKELMKQCVEFWGMAVANLISLFNPEKIIFGGGVFGPGVKFIPDIQREANKWAQPISAKQVIMETSGAGGNAGVIGAAYLAIQSVSNV